MFAGTRRHGFDLPCRLVGEMIAARVTSQNDIDSVEINRLREVMIEPGIARPLPIRFLTISGERE